MAAANKIIFEYERNIDPEKEWERVRLSWRDDLEAWERYSGFKLERTNNAGDAPT